ncbi:MAG: hypothetical protein J6Q72_01600 [Clostridia bacterium]|nr:hypothetical protein [Clostridia bacterium]
MDGDFQEKLKTLLSDPEALGKITSVASELGLVGAPVENRRESEEIGRKPTTESGALGALSAFTQPNDPRIALLCSLKPLVREEKRSRLDALTQALTIASLMKNFRR